MQLEDTFDERGSAISAHQLRSRWKMADQARRSRGDFRLRIMTLAIRHEQQGEIALMKAMEGTAAIATAFRNLLADNVN